MTTSYELSLRLKEFGVEQSNGEYYWVEGKLTGALYCHHKLAENKEYDWEGYEERYTILCRALTLGEIMRMSNSMSISVVDVKPLNYCAIASKYSDEIIFKTSPEEAAGELLAEILKQKQTT